MRLNIYAIFDMVSGSFAQPHCAVNDATATRSCADLVNRDQNIAAHVGDYTLYKIGEYEDSTGTVEGLPKPEMIVRLASLSKSA